MIYADWAATAPLHPAAVKELRHWLEYPVPANPSSVHGFGMAAADRLDAARKKLAAAAGWDGGITFVSGGTEGLALAVHSLAVRALNAGRRRVILSPLEHPALREAVLADPAGLQAEECAVTPEGQVDPADFAARMGEDTAFAAVMTVQNETGVIQPVGECAALAHRCGAYFLTDAVQAAGHITGGILPGDCTAPAERIPDMAVISGHKFGGPAGTGALFHRISPVPLQKGGGQEGGFRGGTENLPGICAMAAALAASAEPAWMAALRDRLERQFVCRMEKAGVPVRIAGDSGRRTGSVSCMVFPDPGGPVGENLVLSADLAGLAVSAGSACHSASPEPSRVLLAMGYTTSEAVRAVRLSFGFGTEKAEMEEAYRILGDTVLRLSGKRAE